MKTKSRAIFTSCLWINSSDSSFTHRKCAIRALVVHTIYSVGRCSTGSIWCLLSAVLAECSRDRMLCEPWAVCSTGQVQWWLMPCAVYTTQLTSLDFNVIRERCQGLWEASSPHAEDASPSYKTTSVRSITALKCGMVSQWWALGTLPLTSRHMACLELFLPIPTSFWGSWDFPQVDQMAGFWMLYTSSVQSSPETGWSPVSLVSSSSFVGNFTHSHFLGLCFFFCKMSVVFPDIQWFWDCQD